MERSDSKKILELLTQLSEAVIGAAPSRPRTDPGGSLSDRVDDLNTRVTALDKKIGTSQSDTPLAGQVDAVAAGLSALNKTIGTSQSAKPLAQQIEALDTRVSDVQFGLATLAVDQKAGFEKVDERFNAVDVRFNAVDVRFNAVDVRFNKIDKRFDQVDRSIESARVEIVDLVTRVHHEVTSRIVDLEVPEPGGKGSGGKGSGGGGVPLAS